MALYVSTCATVYGYRNSLVHVIAIENILSNLLLYVKKFLNESSWLILSLFLLIILWGIYNSFFPLHKTFWSCSSNISCSICDSVILLVTHNSYLKETWLRVENTRYSFLRFLLVEIIFFTDPEEDRFSWMAKSVLNHSYLGNNSEGGEKQCWI